MADISTITTGGTTYNVKDNYARTLLSGEAKIYSVTFTGSASAGVRGNDAVGLVANAGVNNSVVVNDFDHIMPWSGIRRCNTAIVAGKRVPTAFEGEPGYSSTTADVFVYVPRFYYKREYSAVLNAETHSICMKPLPGYDVPAKFKTPDGTIRDYCFLPAYTAGIDANGAPVSRSGYLPHPISLNSWMALLAAKHTAGALAPDIWIESTKDDEIKNILLDVELATRNHQTVMMGACSMRFANDTVVTGGTNQFTLTPASASQYVTGQIIAIGTTAQATQVANDVIVTAINTTTGAISISSSTGSDITVSAGNYISSRPWKSGACDNIAASSGSPISNSFGRCPCKYRGIENPWGNQYRWRWDYLQNNHAPSILLDPTKYAAGAVSADYIPLSYFVPAVDGYATQIGYDPSYPFARVTEAVGGSTTTYFADYYFQHQAADVRALLAGGFINIWSGGGSRFYNVNAEPSSAHWSYGAALSPM